MWFRLTAMTRITSLRYPCLMLAAVTAMGTALRAAELNDYPDRGAR